MHDLFYIDIDNPISLTMEFFPSQLKINSVACGSDHILILSTDPGRVFSKGLGRCLIACYDFVAELTVRGNL